MLHTGLDATSSPIFLPWSGAKQTSVPHYFENIQNLFDDNPSPPSDGGYIVIAMPSPTHVNDNDNKNNNGVAATAMGGRQRNNYPVQDWQQHQQWGGGNGG